jgi:hypothetical protein
MNQPILVKTRINNIQPRRFLIDWRVHLNFHIASCATIIAYILPWMIIPTVTLAENALLSLVPGKPRLDVCKFGHTLK